MKYRQIREGVFLERPNRFIARVLVGGREEVVHVKNTGRCRELLTEGARVYLSASDNPERRTAYDLVAVEKRLPSGEAILINMDSSAPNAAAAEWLAGGLFSPEASVRSEVKFGNSRFDFYVEDGGRRAFVEVKGVTLEEGGIALFPDAPTERGVKHLGELQLAIRQGYEGYILFVIQMKGVTAFRPNDTTHLAFGNALRQCAECGVGIIAMDCRATPEGMEIDAPVRVDLESK